MLFVFGTACGGVRISSGDLCEGRSADRAGRRDRITDLRYRRCNKRDKLPICVNPSRGNVELIVSSNGHESRFPEQKSVQETFSFSGKWDYRRDVNPAVRHLSAVLRVNNCRITAPCAD